MKLDSPSAAQNTEPFDETDKLKKMFIMSVLLHIAVLTAFGLRLLFRTPSAPMIFQSAIRVDMVALPEKSTASAEAPVSTPQETKAAPLPLTPQQTVESVTPKPVALQKDLKKKQSKALDQLKALEALKDEVSREETNKKKTLLNGNILSAGSAIKGINKLDYDQYSGNVEARIKSNWELPEWLARSQLRAQVLVKIDKQGFVIKKEMLKSSNNPTYDSLVLQAIDKSSPFPPPPERLAEIIEFDGIIFQFPE